MTANPFDIVVQDPLISFGADAITRGGKDAYGQSAEKYDFQPTIIYDPLAPESRQFEMWWFGGVDPKIQGTPSDVVPQDLHVGDRIFYAHRSDGNSWSNSQVVDLPGRAQENDPISADAQLIGSPSVVKLNGTYFMFHEAYGMQATVVNRYWSFANGDSWTRNGFPHLNRVQVETRTFGRNELFPPLCEGEPGWRVRATHHPHPDPPPTRGRGQKLMFSN